MSKRKIEVTYVELGETTTEDYLEALGIPYYADGRKPRLNNPKSFMLTRIDGGLRLIVWTGRKPTVAQIRAASKYNCEICDKKMLIGDCVLSDMGWVCPKCKKEYEEDE